jgi:ubiquinone/menaquinone biosynthesis C-methylase UbiE
MSHQEVNRQMWDRAAPQWVEPARVDWATADPCWGIWRIPESEVGALPDVDGLDSVELGCGTAYFSAWLARRGARPVGVDQSKGQLATARAMQAEHGLEFPLIEADAEAVPLPDASFDFALSEYGASLWCEPERWIAEAARLLRPGGRLVFLTNSPLVVLCSAPDAEAATERLARPQFGLYQVEWDDEDGHSIEFHLPHGEMIHVLREAGFEIEALHELQAPEGATSRFEWVPPEWARSWPSEEIWVARKR